MPPWWGFFRAKAPEADAVLITSDLKVEVQGDANTSTFVNGDLLVLDERSLIPWTYAFNFSLKLQSNKLPVHIFLCQMFPLWWIWSTPGPAFEPHPLPVLPQTSLQFQINFIFFPKKWIHLIYSSTWRKMSLPHWLGVGPWWKGWHVTGSSSALCRELSMIKITKAKSLQCPDFLALIKIVFIKVDSWLPLELALWKEWLLDAALGARDPMNTAGQSSIGNGCTVFRLTKPQAPQESWSQLGNYSCPPSLSAGCVRESKQTVIKTSCFDVWFHCHVPDGWESTSKRLWWPQELTVFLFSEHLQAKVWWNWSGLKLRSCDSSGNCQMLLSGPNHAFAGAVFQSDCLSQSDHICYGWRGGESHNKKII